MERKADPLNKDKMVLTMVPLAPNIIRVLACETFLSNWSRLVEELILGEAIPMHFAFPFSFFSVSTRNFKMSAP